MPTEDGHRDTFGGPARKGWPTFDKHGKRINEDEEADSEDR